MHRRIKRLNAVAIILLVLQIFSYLGRITSASETFTDKGELIGYYIGFNLPIIISVIIFIITFTQKRKLKQGTESDTIDSIGRPE